MLVLSENGVHIEQLEYGSYVISVDGIGPILMVKMPWGYQPMVDDDFLRALHKGVAIRTGKYRKRRD